MYNKCNLMYFSIYNEKRFKFIHIKFKKNVSIKYVFINLH